MRVTLNTERCSGHARCYAIAPEVYEIDDNGFCLPLPDRDISEELEQAARDGVDACPENALAIADEE